jgi:hypothetical protein
MFKNADELPKRRPTKTATKTANETTKRLMKHPIKPQRPRAFFRQHPRKALVLFGQHCEKSGLFFAMACMPMCDVQKPSVSGGAAIR